MAKVCSIVLAVVTAISFNACATFHAEMLTKSIESFSSKTKLSATDKVWVTSVADSKCHSGCQLEKIGCKDKGGKLGGGLFSFTESDGSSSYDRLAFEVFANYLVQHGKASIVEGHRHNYATDLVGAVDTRKKIDFKSDDDKAVYSMASCADLCLLDEAKERKADKVLAYRIASAGAKEMTVHFRLSNVKTGIIESAGTVRVVWPTVYDASFIDAPENAK